MKDFLYEENICEKPTRQKYSYRRVRSITVQCKEDGAVLQLKSAKPLGVGFYIYKMGPGTKTIAHKHKGAEEFWIIGDYLTDHNGVNYGPSDLVWLRDGTKHYSYTENGC